MRSLNQCNFIGRLGADPMSYTTKTGNELVKFNLAVNDRSTTNKQTYWIPVIAFNKLGEICKNYLKKGSKVYISGSLTTSDGKTQSGDTYKSFSIVAQDIVMLSDKDGDSKTTSYSSQDSTPSNPFNDLDDEVPF